MNIENNSAFKKLFDSIKERYQAGGEEDDALIYDMKECIANMITAIEFGKGDEAFCGMFLPKMNRYFKEAYPAPAAITIANGTPTLILNPQLLFIMCDDYYDFKCIIQHEIYHLVFKHLVPSRNYPNHDRTNIAMDTSVNQHIRFSENLASQCFTLENFNKKFNVNAEEKREFEYYYDLIPDTFNQTDQTLKQMLKELDDLKKKRQALDGSGNGSGEDQNEGQGSSSGSSSKEGQGNGSGGGSGDIEQQKKDLDQQIDDLKEKIKQYLKDNYVLGDISGNESSSTLSPSEQLTLQELIEGTLSEAKARGKIPGSMESILNDLYFKEPIIPWQKECRNLIGSIPCPYRKTMRVKNRRQPKRADILGRVNDRKIRILLAIDTSGSVSDNCLKYFFNEIFNIVKDVNAEVYLIQCDSDVKSYEQIKTKNDVSKVKIAGRGGTYFTPVFEYIKNEIPKPDQPNLVVYFTDGYGERDIPKELKGHFEILWVLEGLKDNLSVETPEFTKKVRYLNIDNKKYR